ncbi:MAG TPA: YeeE/YedE family protein [Rhodocyclaceae bacterium]|nr:YeeE/YedE family protein [Rhodocyclaceae bacterium]
MTDEPIIAASTIAWLAFALGILFGAVASKTSFCTLGAVSDIVNIGDWNRMRMWALAMAVAMIATSALQFGAVFDPAHSIYTPPRLNWLSHLVGGLLFGTGMSLASGCGSKTLVRLGGGNLKALIVFVFIGLSAYMSLRGLFAVWRVGYLDPVALQLDTAQDVPALLVGMGLSPEQALLAATTVIGGALLAFALARREARQTDVLLGGVAIGLLVAAGWMLTAHIGYVEEHPDTLEQAFIATNSGRAESFSFVAPLAYSLELLMFWSDTSRIVTFGIAASIGVIVGAALHTIASGRFRIESFTNSADLGRHIVGAILMGFGGVTAMGCTIGQGITGVSTLAVGAFITTAAIIAGSALTLRTQYWLMMRGT